MLYNKYNNTRLYHWTKLNCAQCSFENYIYQFQIPVYPIIHNAGSHCINDIIQSFGLIYHANKHLNDWTIDRFSKTDAAILRMGIYELVYTDTPEVVSINEAVELAKEYSDEKVKNMINAVLDKIYHGDNKDE